MTGLEELLLHLADTLPSAAGSVKDGVRVRVEALDLDVPVESRIDAQGLCMSLPRGRLRTGFDPELGRLRLTFVRGDG